MIGLSEDIEARISFVNDLGTRISVVFEPGPFDEAQAPVEPIWNGDHYL
jgi:hypothetical protein